MKRFAASAALALLLGACGGGGGGSGSITTPPTGSAPTPLPSPTPTPTTAAGCSLRERQQWAAAQLREWYLFPETLPTAAFDPTPYSTVSDYVDALTAVARGQGRDRYFTYVASIAEENAYYSSGTTGGFGFRIGAEPGRLLIAEAFEGGPAANAGLDRGVEILGVGTTSGNVRSISAIASSEGSQGLANALTPQRIGDTRVFRVSTPSGVREVTLSSANYSIEPVSTQSGTRIIEHFGERVGYVNLRTFISTADPALRSAFAQFRAAGVTKIIVDLRYNGGGLVSIAKLLGNLLGGGRSDTDVFSYTNFRADKASEDQTDYFTQQPQSIAPVRIAFIATEASASASELVINAMIPYLRQGVVLVGTNTYGKPVGQVAFDLPACDDRLRLVAFSVRNAERRGDYFNGLKDLVPGYCRAADDLNYPMGSVQEASTRTALDVLTQSSCAATATAQAATRLASPARTLLMPERPNTRQRDLPGVY